MEDSKRALASTSVLIVEWAPQNNFGQCLYTQDKLQFPLVSPEAVQEQQVGLSQSSFKLLLLSWVPGHVRFLCTPFKSGVSISNSLLTLPKISPIGVQSQVFLGVHLSGTKFPVWGALCEADSLFLEGNFCNCNYLPICGSLTQGLSLDYIVSPPLISIFL